MSSCLQVSSPSALQPFSWSKSSGFEGYNFPGSQVFPGLGPEGPSPGPGPVPGLGSGLDRPRSRPRP
eukprot:4361640-Alexandrium_andersonii.AAC.1